MRKPKPIKLESKLDSYKKIRKPPVPRTKRFKDKNKQRKEPLE